MREIDPSQVDIERLIFKSSVGDKYELFVDNGILKIGKAKEIPTNGMVTDLIVRDGKCVNRVTEEVFDSFTVNDDNTLYGDENKYGTHTGKNLISKTLTNRSIVCLIDTSDIQDVNTLTRTSFIVGDNYGYYGIEFTPRIIGDLTQNYFRDFGGVFGPADVSFNALDNYAKLTSSAKNDSYPYDKSNIFVAISCDYDNKRIIKSSFNGSYEYTTSATIPERTGVFVLNHTNTKVKIRRVIIYDRALTQEEINDIRSVLVSEYYKTLNSYTWVNGLEGLGSPSAFATASQFLGEVPKFIDTPKQLGDISVEINGETKEYENISWVEPTIDNNPTKFTDIFFTNPIEQLEVSQKYKIEAFPYPYKINDSEYLYGIEYSSSNTDICLCYNGLLIPQKEGDVIITAKISNTSIQKQINIQIIADSILEPNYMYVDESYSNEWGTLKSQNPVQLLKMIFKCIDTAKELGFNGIVFPKGDYKIKPYKEGVHYYVPSNMVIDFSGSSFHIQDNEFCKVNKTEKTQKYYTLFSFGKSTWGDQEGGLYKQCENSVIKNLKYYGERFNTEYTDSDYSEFTNAFYFAAGGVKNCHIENIYFHSTVGFNVSTGHNGFQMWQGTSADGAARGCILSKDLTAGRLDETGTEIMSDETGMWYCTPNPIKLGYNYSDNPTMYTDMKYYTLGRMDTATRPGSSGFWYDIYFYDAEQSLIEYRPYQMTLEKYLLPENAVYFKINTASWGALGNSPVDVPHAQRLWNEGAPYMCSIKNCQFINPHASAISMTGGDSFLIENCYAEQGASFYNLSSALFGWSIDFEDGWLNMRHCIVNKLLCPGTVHNPGGYDTCYINDVISTLRSSGSAQENINVINCFIGTLDCKSKVRDYYNNVSYSSKFETSISSDVSIASIQISNCNKVENSKLFS